MVSLTGIPPTVGFWGKFYLFTAVVDAGYTWLAIVAVVMSAVSAFYYLRVVWYMYFRERAGRATVEPERAGRSLGVSVAVGHRRSRRPCDRPLPAAAAARRRGGRARGHRRLTPPAVRPFGQRRRGPAREDPVVNILFVGDVFGQPGRDALLSWLPGFVAERAVDFVIANGENAANGAGITSKIALRLLDGGVDVITTGNHVWRQREVFPFLARDERIVRPANYPAGAPGRGLTVRPAARRRPGRRHQPCRQPLHGHRPLPLPHRRPAGRRGGAERPRPSSSTCTPRRPARRWPWVTTSTVASPRSSGTHTHVQTSDARVLPGGTAYITDVGMTGPSESVIGVRTDIILRRFLTEMPQQFEVAGGPGAHRRRAGRGRGRPCAAAIETLETIV